jgi:16S rRNA (guanine1207-N2)-methyltransferase
MGKGEVGLDTDIYFKQEIDLRHEGRSLRLRVAQDLFSSFQADAGTRLLLRTLSGVAYERVLDLGCGYGPLGLALNAVESHPDVHMVDRDALAVEYSSQNATLNGLAEVTTYGSLGYDDVAEPAFDLVVCNVPGKAGAPVIGHLLLDAERHVAPGGLVAMVVVDALAASVESTLGLAPNVEITLKEEGARHVVFHYRFGDGALQAPGPERQGLEVYRRGEGAIQIRGHDFPIETAYGLPEFDTIAYPTGLLAAALEGKDDEPVRRALIVNPGQGHVPVALWKLFGSEEIVLAGRDLLELRYSCKNLLASGLSEERISIAHQVGALVDEAKPVDLIAVRLTGSDGPELLEALLRDVSSQVRPGGRVVVAGGSTAIARLVKLLGRDKRLRVEGRKRKKGSAVLTMRAP